MKIAVIGSGISGLGAAHFLSKRHKVDLFEREDHFGGHSYTVEVPLNKKSGFIAIDLGFIVFNKENYPNLEFIQGDLEDENLISSGAILAAIIYIVSFFQEQNFLNIDLSKNDKSLIKQQILI